MVAKTLRLRSTGQPNFRSRPMPEVCPCMLVVLASRARALQQFGHAKLDAIALISHRSGSSMRPTFRRSAMARLVRSP
jgi:hypothetical protein